MLGESSAGDSNLVWMVEEVGRTLPPYYLKAELLCQPLLSVCFSFLQAVHSEFTRFPFLKDALNLVASV